MKSSTATRRVKHAKWARGTEAWKSKDGHWYVRIDFAPFGKALPPKDVPFGSIEEVQRFVAEYFGTKVIKVKPNDFPEPEDL